MLCTKSIEIFIKYDRMKENSVVQIDRNSHAYDVLNVYKIQH